MILTDAGPLIALIDRRDVHHERCVDALDSVRAPMVTSWPALTEAMYLLGDRDGWNAQEKLWRLVLREDLQFVEMNKPLQQRARDLMHQYRDLPMDLADATLVAIAEHRRLRRIFTLDDDFRVYRVHGRKTLEVVPERR